MLEVNQIACLLAIVEEASFSKAAERLGLAQSAVTQKLQRLEDQLGIRLLDRTSRQVSLSEAGKGFIPYAHQLMDAERRARAAAHALKKEARKCLRLGGYPATSYLQIKLVQAYHARNPEVLIEVEHGYRERILEQLREGEVDAALCLAGMNGPLAEFASVHCRRFAAYLAIPLNHPLASHDCIATSDFADLELVMSPGREDRLIVDELRRSLVRLGTILVSAPETERRLIALFSVIRGLASIRWLPAGTARYREDDCVITPVAGDPIYIDYFLYTQKHHRNALLDDFGTFVGALPPLGPALMADEQGFVS